MKQTSLQHPGVRDMLYSADSMAWSFAARKAGRNANDWREAAAFAARVGSAIARGAAAWQMPLPLERIAA